MRRHAAILATFLTAWLPLQAICETSEDLPPQCLTQQEAYIHIIFSMNGTDALALKHQFEDNVSKIEAIAHGIGVTNIFAGGLQYTIQLQSGPTVESLPYVGPVSCLDCLTRSGQPQNKDLSAVSYQLNGHVNFKTEPFAKTPELLKLLLAKHYPVTMSFMEASQSLRHCPINVSTGKWE